MNNILPRALTSALLAAAFAAQTNVAYAASEDDEVAAKRLVQAGVQALEANDGATALEKCSKSLTVAASPTGHLCVARANLQLGKSASAVEAFQQAIRFEVPADALPSWNRAKREAKAEMPSPPEYFQFATDQKDLYWAALADLAAGDFAAAHARVAEAKGAPMALFIRATSQAGMQHDGVAIGLYREVEKSNAPSGLIGASVKRRTAIEALLATVTFAQDLPSDLVVDIDGAVVDAHPGRNFVLRAGKHAIRVRAPGHRPRMLHTEIRPGDSFAVKGPLEKFVSWRTYEYTAYGVGAALAVGSAVFAYTASSTDSELANSCVNGQCGRADHDKIDSRDSAVAMSIGFGIAALASAGAGLAMTMFEESDGLDTPPSKVNLKVSGSTAALTFSF